MVAVLLQAVVCVGAQSLSIWLSTDCGSLILNKNSNLAIVCLTDDTNFKVCKKENTNEQHAAIK